jgi:hypothetical protein
MCLLAYSGLFAAAGVQRFVTGYLPWALLAGSGALLLALGVRARNGRLAAAGVSCPILIGYLGRSHSLALATFAGLALMVLVAVPLARRTKVS